MAQARFSETPAVLNMIMHAKLRESAVDLDFFASMIPTSKLIVLPGDKRLLLAVPGSAKVMLTEKGRLLVTGIQTKKQGVKALWTASQQIEKVRPAIATPPRVPM